MRIVDALGFALAGSFAIGAVAAYGQIGTRSQHGGTATAIVDDKGNLRLPSDYRTAYQMLGIWAVPKDGSPGSKELHVVYASPGTTAAYRKDGHFPDGAVLVKEVFKTTTKDIATGTVSSAGALTGRFVMVKDNAGRFPGNKLCGEGWGWSWFDVTNPQKNISGVTPLKESLIGIDEYCDRMAFDAAATNTNARHLYKREGLVDAVIGFVKPLRSFA